MVAKHTAHHDIWQYRSLRPHLLTKGETFSEGGYDRVPDKKVVNWPHVASWPNLPVVQTPSAKGEAGGVERFVTVRLSKLKLHAAITKLVVTGDLPFRIVELDAGVIPSRWTVARGTVVLADLALDAAIAELASTTCAVSYITDMWTGPNGKAYMVLRGHFVSVQWELRQMILAFVEMPGRHGGKEIAKAVEKVVVQWKLQTRCLSLTTDNASANVVALRHLVEEGEFSGYFSKKAHYRCLSHIVNLAVQSGLGVESMTVPLKKVREITTWVGMSPQREAAFIALQVRHGVLPNGPHKLVQDSPTRWGSTHEMVKRFLLLRPFIDMHFACEQARAAREAPTPPPAAAGVTPFEEDDGEFVFSRAQLQKRVSASAAARVGGGGTTVGDEVDWYLAELPVSDVPALQHWQRARNMDTLRQMARDYLAIPATSAASERAFSMGRDLISLHMHRLNTEHVSASMTLRSWYTSHPGKSIGEEPGRSGEQAPPELALEGEGLDEGDEEEAVAVGGGTGVE
ncbi:unnamed protein product [Closterium sp. NIES-53]